MNAEEIWEEYRKNRRISGRAMRSLRLLLRESGEPMRAIALAGDVAAFQLAEDIARHLSSGDNMVRWNAAGVLFTRFRDVRFSQRCLAMVTEPETNVRGVALVGAGELLALVEDRPMQQELASKLLHVLLAEEESPEMRGAAYEGIEAAVGVPPLERAPASRVLDPEKDFKEAVVKEFRSIYGI